jgi:hypothetical protein
MHKERMHEAGTKNESSREFYHYSYQELIGHLGEEQALEKVRQYQELSMKYKKCLKYVLHECRLLKTFMESSNERLFNTFPATQEIKCSVFYAPITNLTRCKHLPLLNVFELIRSEKFKLHTEHLRSIKNKKQNRHYKATYFAYACFSGTFSRRCEEGLLEHSGLICIDLDHVSQRLGEIRKIIRLEESHVMDFISPNGDGLKVLFKIDPSQYNQALYYQALTHHLTTICNLAPQQIDSSCKDVCRACFLPHDPTVYLNPHYYERF